MASPRHWSVLLCLLALSAWLALSDDKPTQVVAPKRAAGVSPVATRTRAPARIETLADRSVWFSEANALHSDLFIRSSWTANPPPTAPAIASAPATAAPQVPPWRIVGKQQEGPQWQVFLMQDEQSLVVRQGQVLEGIWRIERIEPPVMGVIHLPSGQELHLSIGEAL